MSEIKISVIVPIYNVEKYLKKCLDTVINQTLKEIEIICVNDGSTDNSRKILEKYAKQDPRIIIIDKKNGGLSSARNAGMKVAKGEFIGFVDSDDWVEETMFEKLYKNAKEHDSQMSICGVHRYDDQTKKMLYDDPYFTLGFFDESFDNRCFNHNETSEFLFDLCVMAWNKIYKRSFLEENNSLFPDGLIFEDGPFFFSIYFKMDKVSIVREFLYYYRINRVNSIIQKGDKNFINIFDVTELMWNEIRQLQYFDKIKYYFLKKKFEDAIYRYIMLKKQYRREFYNRFKNFKPFFDTEVFDMELIEKEHLRIYEYMQNLKEKNYNEYQYYCIVQPLKERIMYKIIEILYYTADHYTFKFFGKKFLIKKRDKQLINAWYCEDFLFIRLLKMQIKLRFNYSELEAKKG